MESAIKRVCLWSGPRNISTALLYSFHQRSDTRAIDEPLYAHFLRVSGAPHPMREVCLAAQDTDGERVVREVVLGPSDRPVIFFKQMAHHLVDLDLEFMRHTVNLFLTRDPAQMVPSLAEQLGTPTLRDAGLARQCEILDMLEGWGQRPVVLDSGDLLEAPETYLRAVCRHLEIPFETRMLRWPRGPKPCDGAWAPRWYKGVHGSTGFKRHRSAGRRVPKRIRPLLEECKPLYAYLRTRAVRP